MGDYRNSIFRPNAQKSQIFGQAKLDALPHFLAKSGQIENNLGKKEGCPDTPTFWLDSI